MDAADAVERALRRRAHTQRRGVDRLDADRPGVAPRHQDRRSGGLSAAAHDQHPPRIRRRERRAAGVLGRQQPRRFDHPRGAAGLELLLASDLSCAGLTRASRLRGHGPAKPIGMAGTSPAMTTEESHPPKNIHTAMPSTAMMATVSIRLRCSPKARMPAITASTAALRSSAQMSIAYQRSGPARISWTWPNSTCRANQTDRLRMTPTTAAVIAASAPESRLLARNCSMNGAPAKISNMAGVNVTHVVMAAPSTPAPTGGNGAAARNAARKPTNCV